MSKNRTDKFRPTTDDDALEQTEAHARNYSDQNIKHDVEDVAWDDEDGTEGHATRIKL